MSFKTTLFLFVVLALLSPTACRSKINEHDQNLEPSFVSSSEESVEKEEYNLKLEKFHTWRKEFGKNYDSAKEESERIQIWIDNNGTSFSECPIGIMGPFYFPTRIVLFSFHAFRLH